MSFFAYKTAIIFCTNFYVLSLKYKNLFVSDEKFLYLDSYYIDTVADVTLSYFSLDPTSIAWK